MEDAMIALRNLFWKMERGEWVLTDFTEEKIQQEKWGWAQNLRNIEGLKVPRPSEGGR